MALLSRLVYTPRKTLARRMAFQVHLWCGVLIGLYSAVIGLTGSALVFREEIERGMRPALYELAPGQPTGNRATLDQLLATAVKALPAWQPLGFEQLAETPKSSPVRPVLLYMVPRTVQMAHHSATPDQLLVYLDPRSGALLGARSRYAGLLGFAANVHYYLLAGDRGYVVNGVLALAFLVVALTGWLLWWPGLRRVLAGLRIHSLFRPPGKRNWKRLTWDLHTVGGFWSNPVLIALIATGIYFVFPQPVLRLVSFVTGTDRQVIAAWYADPEVLPHPAEARPIPVREAWERAAAGLPQGVSVSYLALPSPGKPYEAITYYPGTAPYAQPLRIFIDPFNGAILKRMDSRSLPVVLRAVLYVYAVHYGSFAGLFSRVLWFLTGLMPAALFGTGLMMWWNRSLRLTLRRRSSRE